MQNDPEPGSRGAVTKDARWWQMINHARQFENRILEAERALAHQWNCRGCSNCAAVHVLNERLAASLPERHRQAE